MASEEFGDDFMVLKPHEGGSYDLVKLLFSRKTDENSFTDCPTGTHVNEFRRRRLIFISVVAQKMLLSMTKPMAWIGVVFEMWLNCSLSVLLLNLLKGKLVLPDSTSVTFRSTIGNIDKRVDLDKNILYGESRYYGALSIMASKLSYENEAFINNTVTNEWKVIFSIIYLLSIK
ncbi:alpha/beta-Hydrolases superfamily protein [Thalictrum thalictroides]|uniref:Alpha/beta-Hydrolases superfamily protein n=1 Tax=Thalictrum thalictroides TaxID=46969 RepID=A0A7J6WXB8_THATH|nr:alpha/beta-Hydrolases superfamily protein [Thalictrum thalictroides]